MEWYLKCTYKYIQYKVSATDLVFMNKVVDIVISHNSIVSLHLQLHNQLRQQILSGRWLHGSRIPSETQFAEHLKLSRSTIRLALPLAYIDGLIQRTATRSPFLTPPPSN